MSLTHLGVEVFQNDEVLLAALAVVSAPPGVVAARHLMTSRVGLPFQFQLMCYIL